MCENVGFPVSPEYENCTRIVFAVSLKNTVLLPVPVAPAAWGPKVDTHVQSAMAEPALAASIIVAAARRTATAQTIRFISAAPKISSSISKRACHVRGSYPAELLRGWQMFFLLMSEY